jgi:hypothetical protein
MPGIDKDSSIFSAEGFVQAHMRTSDPRTRGVAAVFIVKMAMRIVGVGIMDE